MSRRPSPAGARTPALSTGCSRPTPGNGRPPRLGTGFATRSRPSPGRWADSTRKGRPTRPRTYRSGAGPWGSRRWPWPPRATPCWPKSPTSCSESPTSQPTNAPTGPTSPTTWWCGLRATTRVAIATTSGCPTGRWARSWGSSTWNGEPSSRGRCLSCTPAVVPPSAERSCSTAWTATPTPTGRCAPRRWSVLRR